MAIVKQWVLALLSYPSIIVSQPEDPELVCIPYPAVQLFYETGYTGPFLGPHFRCGMRGLISPHLEMETSAVVYFGEPRGYLSLGIYERHYNLSAGFEALTTIRDGTIFVNTGSRLRYDLTPLFSITAGVYIYEWSYYSCFPSWTISIQRRI